MRVLHIVNWLTTGGLEIQLLRSIDSFHQAGVRIDVCCLGPEKELDQSFLDKGVLIHRIPKFLNPYRTAKAIKLLLRKNNYDILHSHFGHSSGGIALGASLNRTPCIVSFHSCEPLSLYAWKDRSILRLIRGKWLQIHEKMLRKYASLLVGQSVANIAAFEPNWRTNTEKFAVLNNGIPIPTAIAKADARQQLRLPETRFIILHVGRFTPPKNHIGLLKIVASLKALNPLLILVGEGPLAASIKSEVKQLNIEALFVGKQYDVWPYYFASDLLLFPSTSEGLANVILEAQAAKLPIIASDIPAHREALVAINHDRLFSLDRPSDVILIANKKMTEASLEAGYLHVKENFSIETLVKNTIQIYDGLVNKTSFQ